MSMKTIRTLMIATTTLVGVTGLAATANAQTPPPAAPQQVAPQVPGQAPMQMAPRISVSQLATKLEQAGYTIRDIEHKRYGWEVDVIDQNQQLLELKVDMQGNITRQKYDD